MRSPWLLLAAALLLPAAPASASGSSIPATCASADASLQRGSLAKARSEYLDVLASESSSACATRGLQQVTAATHQEERLCEEGKVLAEHDESEEARRRYVAALGKNNASKCAAKGLGGESGSESESKEGKGWVEEAKDWVTNALGLIGAVLIALLVVIGALLAAWAVFKARGPSLVVEPFADGAVEPKIGPTVAGLVEKHLIEISRLDGRSQDSYMLDLVVADVELLAANEGLEKALGGLAETSQLKLAVAVLAMLERTFGTHLIAKGELAPGGGEGPGLLLALQSQKKGLEARGALWASPTEETTTPPPSTPSITGLLHLGTSGAKAKSGTDEAKDPGPYYKLADQAAAWVQYEAARSIDSQVEKLTTSAKSFSLLAQGLGALRSGKRADAADLFAEALEVDPQNVGAMVNLSHYLSRGEARYEEADQILGRAQAILEERYAESEAEREYGERA